MDRVQILRDQDGTGVYVEHTGRLVNPLAFMYLDIKRVCLPRSQDIEAPRSFGPE